ncbi:helix-turn-helix domain-containing protein [Deinococcus puniceus]|uniref:helix-turn-helix domain-containing protein n=1 Tax=Deinococcus puniceus TaxID=1182568 RepID=UPI0009EDCA8A
MPTASLSLDTLTTREQALVSELARGACNKRIASALGITEGTVKVHLSNIFRKLRVKSRAEVMLEVLGPLGITEDELQQIVRLARL